MMMTMIVASYNV